MVRLAVLAVLASCGDGIAPLAPDAAPPADGAERGLVRVQVSGLVEKAGLVVYFQDHASSLVLATRTDGDGRASAFLGPDSFVTILTGHAPVGTAWTYTGVQPGDVLDFHQLDLEGVDPSFDQASLAVFVTSLLDDPPYTLHTPCGAMAVPIRPVTLQLAGCPPVMDLVLMRADGLAYQFADAVALEDHEVSFDGAFLPLDESTIQVVNVPGQELFVLHSLVQDQYELVSSGLQFSPLIVDGRADVTRAIPLPRGATMLTQLDLGFDQHHVIDWRPAVAHTTIDAGRVLRRSTRAPTYDATRTAIEWGEEDTGLRGNLIRATMQWQNDDGEIRIWEIAGPRGDDTVLHLPLLPETALRPTVDTPQSVVSLAVDDGLAWARTHLIGRWFPNGIWPTYGPAGRVTWRDL